MYKLLAVLFAAMLIAGCKTGGSSSGGGDSSFVSGSSSSGGSTGGGDSSFVSGSSSSGGSTGGGDIPIGSNPEPATIAMLGIGLGGLAAAKLKNRNKRK